jgi:hypothetical protein
VISHSPARRHEHRRPCSADWRRVKAPCG